MKTYRIKIITESHVVVEASDRAEADEIALDKQARGEVEWKDVQIGEIEE